MFILATDTLYKGGNTGHAAQGNPFYPVRVQVAVGAALALRFSDQAGAIFWVVPAANLATPWLDRLLLPGGPR